MNAKAIGHVAQIVSFDDETALVPLSLAEARMLLNAALDVQLRLQMSNDYPVAEQQLHNRVIYNLRTAMSVIKR